MVGGCELELNHVSNGSLKVVWAVAQGSICVTDLDNMDCDGRSSGHCCGLGNHCQSRNKEAGVLHFDWIWIWILRGKRKEFDDRLLRIVDKASSA